VIREIEIWRVAMLMVNRYADGAGANSFQRAEQLAADRMLRSILPERRNGAYLARNWKFEFISLQRRVGRNSEARPEVDAIGKQVVEYGSFVRIRLSNASSAMARAEARRERQA
jgi:hypothetical protein